MANEQSLDDKLKEEFLKFISGALIDTSALDPKIQKIIKDHLINVFSINKFNDKIQCKMVGDDIFVYSLGNDSRQTKFLTFVIPGEKVRALKHKNALIQKAGEI